MKTTNRKTQHSPSNPSEAQEPHPENRSPRPETDLLIGLHVEKNLARPALARLAEDLDAWTGPGPGSTERLARELGVPKRQLETALAALPGARAAGAAERERAAAFGGRIVTRLDSDYPPALGQLPLPPPVLSIAGELPTGPAVAIVGSRRADAYGLEVATLFASALAEREIAVISGFARGIDAAAHRGALAPLSGRTVAILGCGLGIDYPRGHAALGKAIAARGALVSEFPCGYEPRSWNFPVRNRSIAALSQAVLVVQAAARSGSLSTARWALDLGRDLFAVPGQIFDERSLGPHALLRDGAFLAQHPKDLFELFAPPAARQLSIPIKEAEAPEPPLPGLAGAILEALVPGFDRAPEDLAVATGAPIDRVLATLLELELLGRVLRMPGGRYRRG
ncbi:MAG TPA: DNA-processing protein DprA [Thermoanaerobaculia bacterium]|jgi:DNA processing protein|nr:DNA-processing protein DprA [Thermoanaerobaculia bacterium]